MATSSWYTIESDPTVFDSIIKNIGGEGFDVKEVFDLDVPPENPLAFIFCFRYQTPHPKDTGFAQTKENAPESLFFANQVITNACGTQAILHALLNLQSLPQECRIGKTLQNFQDFTKLMTFSVRGLCVSNCALLKKVHNRHIRLPMSEEWMGFVHEPTTEVRKRRKRRFEENDEEEREEERVYHFITYVPHNGATWELDGLFPGPVELPTRNRRKPWYFNALNHIKSKMAMYNDDDQRFSLLAIVPEKLSQLRSQIQNYMKSEEFKQEPIELIQVKQEQIQEQMQETNQEQEIDPIHEPMQEESIQETKEQMHEEFLPECLKEENIQETEMKIKRYLVEEHDIFAEDLKNKGITLDTDLSDVSSAEIDLQDYELYEVKEEEEEMEVEVKQEFIDEIQEVEMQEVPLELKVEMDEIQNELNAETQQNLLNEIELEEIEQEEKRVYIRRMQFNYLPLIKKWLQELAICDPEFVKNVLRETLTRKQLREEETE